MKARNSKNRNRIYALVSLFLLVIGLDQPPAHATGESLDFLHRSSDLASVAGTVELNGCRIRPWQLRIEVSPVIFGIDDVKMAAGRFDRPRRAFVLRTADRHVFRFFIPFLHASRTYQLRIAAPPNPCGEVFWRGAFEGLVVGGDTGVRIEGIAATSEVEVYDQAADEWTGATTFSLADAHTGGASKNLRWRSSLRGVESGELQISSSAFPTEGDFGACDEPVAGLVARVTVPIDPDGWTELGEFNFSSLLGRTFEPPDGEFPPFAQTDPDLAGRDDGENGNTVPLSAPEEMLVTMGVPLYVRVIPKRSDGPACDLRGDGVAGWAMVANDVGLQQVEIPPTPPPPSPLQAGDGHYYQPPFIEQDVTGSIIPGYGQQAYVVTKSHTLPAYYCINAIGFSQLRKEDPIGCALLDVGLAAGRPDIVPGATVGQPGQSPLIFFFTPSTGGGGGGGFNPLTAITSSYGALITGALSFAESGINALAKLADDVKQLLADVALAALTLEPFGSACDALPSVGPSCEDLVKAGITAGMVSMGLPPSLPNFDDLKNAGVEYIAGQIQAQTGLPPPIAEEALKMALETLEDMGRRAGGKDPKSNWVTPYLGLQPAIAEIVIQQNTADPIPDGLLLLRKTTDLFEGAPVSIPSVFPASGALRIPMQLKPNIAGITNPVCRYGFFETSCEPGFLATKPVCLSQIDYQGTLWNEFKCEAAGAFSAPNLYFRNEWYRQRYQPATCTTVSGISRRSSGLGPVPPPLGYEFWMSTSFNPKQQHGWSGVFEYSCF